MVLYELFLTTKNTTPFPALSSLMEKISMEVVKDGGVVRSIQNHGIRDLPHRIKAKRPDIFGKRYFDKGRFVSIYYDGNPNTNRMIENVLVFNEEVIRRATLKARNPLWFVNIAREEKNPYIKRVRRTEHQERMHQQQLDKQARVAAAMQAMAEEGAGQAAADEFAAATAAMSEDVQMEESSTPDESMSDASETIRSQPE